MSSDADLVFRIPANLDRALPDGLGKGQLLLPVHVDRDPPVVGVVHREPPGVPVHAGCEAASAAVLGHPPMGGARAVVTISSPA